MTAFLPATTGPDTLTRALRRVHRAVSELRRGVPVLLEGDAPLLLLAMETAGAVSLAEFESLGTAPPLALFAPVRGAAVLRRPIDGDTEVLAAVLPPALANPDALRGLADPTTAQPVTSGMQPVGAPPGAAAAIALAKLGRLLPAVLAVTPISVADLAERALIGVSAADVLAYPAMEGAGLRIVASASVPLEGAQDARVVAFRAEGSAFEHLAIVIGRPEETENPLVRIHSECFTGDLLGSMRCDCGEQLRGAIHRIAAHGVGVVLYLAQEGRGIGLVNKLRAYTLQDRGLDTMDANRVLGWGADERNFLVGANMLLALGIARVRLLTNNPDKIAGLTACGVEVVGREAHAFASNEVNDAYLATKAVRFGHMLD
ncbi:MAG: GTP cyclohydrolase II [Acetobacteraceae bacterium]|nr:GTP cyclohydrolase II [Acetobacteraceae bacterium]